MINFHDQTIMISGGSQGIGFATAERLGKLGAKLSICARGEEALQQAQKSLQQQGIDALTSVADISKKGDVEAWFQKTEEHFGPASILVNNAGIHGHASFMDITEEQWDQTMGVNTRGAFLCAQRAIPAMKKMGAGRIVFIGSIASQYFRKGYALYFASKWALKGFALSLAKELHHDNIHINIICPGMTETNFFDELGGRPHEPDMAYVQPSLVAEYVEHLCRLPEDVDATEFCLFPAWQFRSLGVRR